MQIYINCADLRESRRQSLSSIGLEIIFHESLVDEEPLSASLPSNPGNGVLTNQLREHLRG